MTPSHPEFDVVIAQMRSLEGLFLSETPDKPIIAKDLLPICEAIRTLAEKLSAMNAGCAEPEEGELEVAGSAR